LPKADFGWRTKHGLNFRYIVRWNSLKRRLCIALIGPRQKN